MSVYEFTKLVNKYRKHLYSLGNNKLFRYTVDQVLDGFIEYYKEHYEY